MNKLAIAIVLLSVFGLYAPAISQAQLRVVTYNTLDKPDGATDDSQLRTIFDAIAATDRNGFAKRPDIIGLQEQKTFSQFDSTASRIANELNDLYGVASYDSTLIGFGVDRIAVVYDSATVGLSSSTLITTGGPRQTQRVEFQPVGYTDSAASLYSYVSHLKASSSGANQAIRATETTAIRANADALAGGDANIIYMGDFNFSSINEAGYANLRASGAAQAVDPLGLTSWNSFNAEHMTQSTRTSFQFDGGATGGMDDRFDLQLVTAELLDGEGLSYLGPSSTGLGALEHSQQAFGNDGVSWNTRINNTFVGRSQSSTVINALHDFSDHLPVVTDFQLPAIMQVVTDSLPATLDLGELFGLDVLVQNVADVLVALGADELDYSISTSGDLFGAFSGTELALGSGSTHSVGFDTSTAGSKSGVLTISSTSQGAENSLVTIPVSYDVLAAMLAGDANGDGTVDLLDLDILGTNFGASPAAFAQGDFNEDNVVDLLDLDILGTNFGAMSSAAVPEPTTLLLLMIGLVSSVTRRNG